MIEEIGPQVAIVQEELLWHVLNKFYENRQE